MRKAQKRQIEAFVKLLGEAHNEIKKYLNKGAGNEAAILLENCQQETIRLGKLIEDIEDEGFETVSILEDYCELLYLIHEEIVQDNIRNNMKLYKKLRNKLIQIENSVKYDIKVRKEIVFFPYKASMWDSLESVWKAAVKEKEYDVYVVPIPYFDKNPDGSLGKMHYEGDQYPEDVPVVSWRDYNLSDRMPDIVFIHNPYDECNYVTSVHPDYYASELKKYTDLLVYISYFVAVGDKMEGHFCRTPGVFLADRVIVQSEAVRDIYVKELRQCEIEYNCKGTFGDIEEKILALGSPKYDRLVTAGRNSGKIPEEWERLLLRSDGSRRKVVLYNTTVDGILRHSDKALEKVRDVIRTFEEEKDNVLLWRPHPLLLTALEAMRTEMAGEYQQIVKEFKSNETGIYDDSADMYRAIAVSDAYYGDMSSVVELYKRTGKPILIESIDYESNAGLVFQALVQVDVNTAYASCALFNGLFKVDLKTGDCAYLGMFQQEPADGFRLHARAVYANEKIYFVPFVARNVSIYCIRTGRLDSISLGKCGFGESSNGSHKFSDALCYGDSLFLVCFDRPVIVEMKLQTGEIKCHGECMHTEGTFLSGRLEQLDSLFYVPNVSGNTVLEFHMDDCTWKLHHIGNDSSAGWGDVCKGEDGCWLIPGKQGPVIKWNPDTGKEERYHDYPDGFQGNRFLFSKGYRMDRYVKLLPAYANMAVRICEESGKMAISDFREAESGYEIVYLFEAGQDIYFLKAKENSINRNPSSWNFYEHFKLNVADDSVVKFSFRFREGRERFRADHRQYINNINGGRSVRRECLVSDLGELLHLISEESNMDNRIADIACLQKSAGEVICKTILELADKGD